MNELETAEYIGMGMTVISALLTLWAVFRDSGPEREKPRFRDDLGKARARDDLGAAKLGNPSRIFKGGYGKFREPGAEMFKTAEDFEKPEYIRDVFAASVYGQSPEKAKLEKLGPGQTLSLKPGEETRIIETTEERVRELTDMMENRASFYKFNNAKIHWWDPAEDVGVGGEDRIYSEF